MAETPPAAGVVAERLFNYVGDLLYTPDQARLDVETLPEEFRDLGRGLLYLGKQLAELRSLAGSLARGNLSDPPPGPDNDLAAPLKSLQASLRHLTWQSQQVAKGDYQQHVDFMGDFADAFNAMTRQLDAQRGALLRDLESGRRKKLALEQNLELFKSLTDHSPQMLFVLERETKKRLFVNATARNAMEADPALAAALWRWLERRMDEPVAEEGAARPAEEAEVVTPGKTFHFDVNISPFSWLQHNAIALVASDRSEEHERMQALEDVAYRDALTQAGSRHYGMKLLHQWTGERRRFCLCFVDLDSLKYVNDVFGHNAGDEYIVQVARLLSAFSPDVEVCRLGGDEFMLLQRDWTAARAEARLAELRAELAGQDTGPEQPYTRSISYGVVEATPDNKEPASDLLSAADEKMYLFKRAHKKQRKP